MAGAGLVGVAVHGWGSESEPERLSLFIKMLHMIERMGLC